MFLRSKRAYAANEITITLVNSENKRSRITLAVNTNIQHLYQIFYDRRSTQFRLVALADYQRAINLSFQDNKLKNTQSTLQASNIIDGSIIRETFKKWVNGINVDDSHLTVTDPITLMPIVGKPVLLSNCNHAFEKEPIATWIEQRLRNNEETNCPCCRVAISDEQIDKLVPVRPEPLTRIIRIDIPMQSINELIAEGLPLTFALILLNTVLANDDVDINNENEEQHGAGAAAPTLFGFFENSESSLSTPTTPNISLSDDEDEKSEEIRTATSSRKRKRDDDSDNDRPRPGH